MVAECTARSMRCSGTRTWGIALADLARHLADAFAADHGRAVDVTLADIRAGFEDELDEPTDKPTGGFVS